MVMGYSRLFDIGMHEVSAPRVVITESDENVFSHFIFLNEQQVFL